MGNWLAARTNSTYHQDKFNLAEKSRVLRHSRSFWRCLLGHFRPSGRLCTLSARALTKNSGSEKPSVFTPQTRISESAPLRLEYSGTPHAKGKSAFQIYEPNPEDPPRSLPRGQGEGPVGNPGNKRLIPLQDKAHNRPRHGTAGCKGKDAFHRVPD